MDRVFPRPPIIYHLFGLIHWIGRNFLTKPMLPSKKLRAHSRQLENFQGIGSAQIAPISDHTQSGYCSCMTRLRRGRQFRTKDPCSIFHHDEHCRLWPVLFIGRLYFMDLPLGGGQAKRGPTHSWTGAPASALTWFVLTGTEMAQPRRRWQCTCHSLRELGRSRLCLSNK